MGWVAAKAQVAAIVKGTTPTTKARGLPSSFALAPAGGDDNVPDSRGFWLEVDAVSERRIIRSAGAAWTTADVTIAIAYRYDVDRDKLLDAQMQDYRELTKRLLDDSQWGRPTSTITRIGDGDRLLGATFERIDGASIVRIKIPVDYT